MHPNFFILTVANLHIRSFSSNVLFTNGGRKKFAALGIISAKMCGWYERNRHYLQQKLVQELATSLAKH